MLGIEVAGEVLYKRLPFVAQKQTGLVIGSVVYGSVLLVAVVFSAASLYALMSVAVQRCAREIGIRIGLGATPGACLRTVLAVPGRQLGGGIIAGNRIVLLIAWRAERCVFNPPRRYGKVDLQVARGIARETSPGATNRHTTRRTTFPARCFRPFRGRDDRAQRTSMFGG